MLKNDNLVTGFLLAAALGANLHWGHRGFIGNYLGMETLEWHLCV